MTATVPPSREVVRHYHDREGWALVVDTDDVDIYTYRPDGSDRYLVRVVDCDGTRIAHRYVDVRPCRVVLIINAHTPEAV